MYNLDMMIQRIKSLKKDKKISTKDLSIQSSIPVGTLNKILCGETKDPQISSIIKIASALDVSADYLVFGTVLSNVKSAPSTDTGIELYNQLDDIDKAEIRGEMKQMLKAEKYNDIQKGLQNA